LTVVEVTVDVDSIDATSRPKFETYATALTSEQAAILLLEFD
jgi:hypothetical protein